MSKNRQATTMIMGSLKELLKNRDYAYVSKSNPKFSHLEDAGKAFVVELIENVLPILVDAENARIRNEAEELFLQRIEGTDVK